jgi:hypothetical protein
VKLSIRNELLHRSNLIALALLSTLLLLPACSSTKGGQSGSAATANTNSASAPMAPASPPIASTTPSAQSTPAAVPTPSHEHLAGIGSATVVTIHGKIVAVDRDKKLVTLEGPNGKKITLEVKNPYNLAAAKPGEPFVARFYEIVTVRKKRPGESIPAVVLDAGIVSAMPGQTPGAAVGGSVQVVATIVAINKSKKTVDLKGPDGVVETVKVANPANLRHVKVGTDLVITLTKVTAISLDRETSSSAVITRSYATCRPFHPIPPSGFDKRAILSYVKMVIGLGRVVPFRAVGLVEDSSLSR